ncbi:hypothetical protein GIB67_043291 [Kingdonia uniflora]|uniref:Heparanase-like protein 1 n=1 Tax=Kingdonia uniflora TaxID=39325 RepID=A0A7J7MJA8_9MAGN|nr:hypothetical protein GIB67_043291 [Kingdonia uniflora]
MGFWLTLLLFLVLHPCVLAEETVYASIVVKGDTKIAETDDNFICATIDWWPPDKCNYNHCPWEDPQLYICHLRIRIGGSLQDQVVYDVGGLKYPCHPFRKMAYGLFGFSKGCLHMDRWDELNHLLSKTGKLVINILHAYLKVEVKHILLGRLYRFLYRAIVTFGLNALYGRQKIRKSVWGGAWDSSNALLFLWFVPCALKLLNSLNLQGNELSGSGIGASVGAVQYGKDLIYLKAIINELYANHKSKPSLLAPGGFYDPEWYAKLLEITGSRVVNAMTHHIYNLGAGDDPRLVSRILDPHYLNQISETFIKLQQTLEKHGSWASAWVGESGGAYNSGGRHVSNTFVNSFWYLDQLGMASKHNTKAYCRQTLIGGNYGLLNTTTYVPNPDYYRQDILHYKRNMDFLGTFREGSSFMNGLKKTVSWVGRKASAERIMREEYHLTPMNGNLRSQTMYLNGNPLKLTKDGQIPTFDPILVEVNSLVFVASLSIAFITFPNFEASACI